MYVCCVLCAAPMCIESMIDDDNKARRATARKARRRRQALHSSTLIHATQYPAGLVLHWRERLDAGHNSTVLLLHYVPEEHPQMRCEQHLHWDAAPDTLLPPPAADGIGGIGSEEEGAGDEGSTGVEQAEASLAHLGQFAAPDSSNRGNAGTASGTDTDAP